MNQRCLYTTSGEQVQLPKAKNISGLDGLSEQALIAKVDELPSNTKFFPISAINFMQTRLDFLYSYAKEIIDSNNNYTHEYLAMKKTSAGKSSAHELSTQEPEQATLPFYYCNIL
jgi:hypothetical protein